MCECDRPIDSWEKRTDVPQQGYSYLQLSANEFFKDALPNQLISIYVGVEYVGQPPHVYGGGVYRIKTAIGYPSLIDKMYTFSYGSVK